MGVIGIGYATTLPSGLVSRIAHMHNLPARILKWYNGKCMVKYVGVLSVFTVTLVVLVVWMISSCRLPSALQRHETCHAKRSRSSLVSTPVGSTLPAGPMRGVQAQWSTYRNAELGFMFNFPMDWKVRTLTETDLDAEYGLGADRPVTMLKLTPFERRTFVVPGTPNAALPGITLNVSRRTIQSVRESSLEEIQGTFVDRRIGVVSASYMRGVNKAYDPWYGGIELHVVYEHPDQKLTFLWQAFDFDDQFSTGDESTLNTILSTFTFL
jgi:hypothetical protein